MPSYTFAIPPFATGLPHLYYWHTTFENNHILPQHDENNSRLRDGGGCLYLFDIFGIGKAVLQLQYCNYLVINYFASFCKAKGSI